MSKARSFWGAVFSQVTFFWLVLAVFMVVSVSQLGDFFNIAIVHGAFYGTLGYAVAAVFDLLSLVFMLARLNAARIADTRGEWLSLFGVTICAGVSAFGNVASSLQSYDVSKFNHIPAWMGQVSPYLGLVFPSMIVVVSIIADHVGDLSPNKADSVEKYRAKEMKKVELLRVRLEIERELSGVRLQMAALKQKPGKKQQHTIATIQAHYDTQIRDMSEEIESLKMMLAPVQGRSTDELETVPQTVPETVPQSVPKTVSHKGDTSALKAVRRAVKHNPEVKPADLAKKAQISAGYASKLKTRVLAETLQVAATN